MYKFTNFYQWWLAVLVLSIASVSLSSLSMMMHVLIIRLASSFQRKYKYYIIIKYSLLYFRWYSESHKEISDKHRASWRPVKKKTLCGISCIRGDNSLGELRMGVDFLVWWCLKDRTETTPDCRQLLDAQVLNHVMSKGIILSKRFILKILCDQLKLVFYIFDDDHFITYVIMTSYVCIINCKWDVCFYLRF